MDKFQTHYNTKLFPRKPEVPGTNRMVESAGYISAKQRIENLILAGQRLAAYRKEQFDFPDGEFDEDFSDPTRSRGYDMSDAFQTSEMLKAKKKRSDEEQKKAAQAAKNEGGKTPPSSPSTETEVK